MITDKLILWLVSIVDDVSEDLGTYRLPGWVDDASGFAGTVFGGASSMGAWFPFGLLAVVASGVFASLLVGFGIKLSRLGLGFASRRSV